MSEGIKDNNNIKEIDSLETYEKTKEELKTIVN